MSIKVSRKENASKFLGLIVNKTVFLSTLTVLIFSVLFTLIFKEEADLYFGQAQTFVSAHGGWIYTLAVNFFILFCFYLAFSKFGSLRIGGNKARPEFSGWSWFAMLFSAGIGNGLVLFSIADPVRDYLNPPRLAGESPVLIAQEAINFSFLHHGIHGWAIYCLVGLSLAYFTFNRKMPLTLRSVFYPIFGNRIYGWMGDVIDVMAVITTLFGLATTIGFGVGQINSGFTHVFGLPSSLFYQVIIITVVTLAATLSAVGLQDLLEFTKLCRRHQARERQLVGSTSHRNCHRLQRLSRGHRSPLFNQGTALNGERLGQICISEIQMPARNLDVEAVSQGGLQLLQVGSGKRHLR